MNTYPVSEAEMDNISSLSAQATARYSIATFLFGLGASIWINATFYTEFTPEAKLATRYVAPFLIVASVGFIIGGIWAQLKRKSAWGKIKESSNPVEAFATPLVVPAEAPVVATMSDHPVPAGGAG